MKLFKLVLPKLTFIVILLVSITFFYAQSSEAKRGLFGIGNWCGTGNNGGEVDPEIPVLDGYCMVHDRCLLASGLATSSFNELKNDKSKRNKSCHCDRVFYRQVLSYTKPEKLKAALVMPTIRRYASRRMDLTCNHNLKLMGFIGPGF